MSRQYWIAGIVLLVIAALAIASSLSIPYSGTSPYAIRPSLGGSADGKGTADSTNTLSQTPWMGGLTVADFEPTSLDPAYYSTQCGAANGDLAFFHSVVFAAKKVSVSGKEEIVYLSDPVTTTPPPNDQVISDPMKDDPLCVLGINYHLPNTDLHDGSSWTHTAPTDRHNGVSDTHYVTSVSHASSTTSHLSYSFEHDSGTNQHHQTTLSHDATSSTFTLPNYHSAASEIHTPPSANTHGAGSGIHSGSSSFVTGPPGP